MKDWRVQHKVENKTICQDGYLNGLYLPGIYLLKNKYSPNVFLIFFFCMASGVKEDSYQDLESNATAWFIHFTGH